MPCHRAHMAYSPVALGEHKVCRLHCDADVEGHNGDIIVKLLRHGHSIQPTIPQGFNLHKKGLL